MSLGSYNSWRGHSKGTCLLGPCLLVLYISNNQSMEIHIHSQSFNLFHSTILTSNNWDCKPITAMESLPHHTCVAPPSSTSFTLQHPTTTGFDSNGAETNRYNETIGPHSQITLEKAWTKHYVHYRNKLKHFCLYFVDKTNPPFSTKHNSTNQPNKRSGRKTMPSCPAT